MKLEAVDTKRGDEEPAVMEVKWCWDGEGVVEEEIVVEEGKVEKKKQKQVIPSKAIDKEAACSRIASCIDSVLLRLELDDNKPLRDRIQAVGQQYALLSSARHIYHKHASYIAVACIQHCSPGMRGRDIRLAAANGMEMSKMGTAKWLHQLYKTLPTQITPPSRADRLYGYLERFMTMKGMLLTAYEHRVARSLASWVLFLIALGNVLPPVGVNGKPYMNKPKVGMQWASERLRPPEAPRSLGKAGMRGVRRVRAGDSVRDCAFLEPLVRMTMPATTDPNDGHERTICEQYQYWLGKLRSNAAIDGLHSNPPMYDRSAWPLNNKHDSSLAVAIIWHATQLRTPLPKGDPSRLKRARPMPVAVMGDSLNLHVLYRMRQEDVIAITQTSKVTITDVKEVLHDMFFCLF